jgi:hypothetical protein
MIHAGPRTRSAEDLVCGSGQHDRRASRRPSKRKASSDRRERDDPRRGREARPEGFSQHAGQPVCIAPGQPSVTITCNPTPEGRVSAVVHGPESRQRVEIGVRAGEC